MPRTSLARHATAIAIVLLIFFAQGPIQRLVGPTGPPLIFFVPAVTISAWQGGGGPGLLATASRQADDGSDNLLVRPPMICVGPLACIVKVLPGGWVARCEPCIPVEGEAAPRKGR